MTTIKNNLSWQGVFLDPIQVSFSLLSTKDKSKQKDLRDHLMQGADQAESGQFIDDFSMDSLIDDLDKEA